MVTRERNAAGIGMTSQRTRDRLVEALSAQGIEDKRVLDALRRVPRHLFVDEALESRAYENTPLPIGSGQTISQPWVVARMTELILENGVPERVLEIGTGSGYQAAVLAELVPEVYTVERIGALAKQARERLRQAGLRNCHVRHADGYEGWSAYAPYPAILLTAAPETVPERLLEQLADNGRLVAPVGGSGYQELVVVDRQGDRLIQRRVAGVSFVPMLHGER